MNCRSFRKRQAELLDTSPDLNATADLRQHLDNCPMCAQEFGELRGLLTALTPSEKACASPELKERIMSKVDGLEAGKTAPKRNIFATRITRLGFAVMLLLGIIAGSRLLIPGAGISPFETLAEAAESISGVKSMHIAAKMRTLPSDNFDTVNPDNKFTPVEIWKVNGSTPGWRVEKSGRVITMNGSRTLLLIQPDDADANTMAVKLDGNAEGTIGWLAPLLNIDALFLSERDTASRKGAEVSVKRVNEQNGGSVILTIRSKAEGDYSQFDYLKNKTIMTSNNTRIYTFDADTMRLRNMQVYMNVNDSDILVFETTVIEYDVQVDGTLTNTDIPVGARLVDIPGQSAPYSGNASETPEETARVFFQYLADSNWNALHPIAGTLFDDAGLQKQFGGLKVLSLGKAFRSGNYPGWFVPYEICLKSGETKKHNLAIRNDTPQHLWVFDGGL
ncbi:MAG: anti-sigma factor family protein [Armatimonadota bacterium]